MSVCTVTVKTETLVPELVSITSTNTMFIEDATLCEGRCHVSAILFFRHKCGLATNIPRACLVRCLAPQKYRARLLPTRLNIQWLTFTKALLGSTHRHAHRTRLRHVLTTKQIRKLTQICNLDNVVCKLLTPTSGARYRLKFAMARQCFTIRI